MKKIMHFLFLSCLKATELIERKLHIKQTIKEKIQLKMHTLMCDACTNYEKHKLIMEKGLAKQASLKDDDLDLDAFKKSIVEKLEK